VAVVPLLQFPVLRIKALNTTCRYLLRPSAFQDALAALTKNTLAGTTHSVYTPDDWKFLGRFS
jgi:hypothetical protein